MIAMGDNVKQNQMLLDILERCVIQLGGCPACFLILKGVVISSHETNRFS